MNATVLIEVIIGIVVPVGATLLAVWDARRCRRAKSPPLQRGSARDHANWHSAKTRDLLRILIAQRRPISRKQLIEQLWPEADPVAASNRLSALLSKSHNATQSRGRIGQLASDGTLVWLRM